MEITDIILVTENWKGSETNSLMELLDYIDYIGENGWMTWKEMAEDMSALGRTLTDKGAWMESYIAADKSISARYCADENQMTDFLQGAYNTDKEWRFDRQKCSGECLDFLKVRGISMDGKTGVTPMHYEKLESTFTPGEILHNFNRRNYRVMECLSKKNLLLMDVESGRFVVAVDTEKYRRSPKDMEETEKNSAVGIEWGHGYYLSSVPSEIDFRRLRQEHGTPQKIKDLQDYRSYLKKQFNMLDILAEDRLATKNVRKAAAEAMFEKFGTDRGETFLHKLSNGDYDGKFIRKTKQRDGREI